MVTIPLDTSVPAQRPWFRSWADFPNLALTTTFSAVNRNVYQVRRWERDPMGISRRSQDFFQNNLVRTTLRGQDAFLRQPRVQLGRGPDPLPFRDRFYSQNLVLTTLRGQDQRPPRTQVFDRPILTVQPDRSWVWPSPIQLLAAIPFPLNQYSWPLPIRAAQPDRFWVQNLVLGTLAGQDTPLVGQQFWERPRATVQLDRSFTGTPFPLFAVLPFPTNQYDWPLPARAIQPDRTWIQNLIGTTLAGQDQFLTQPRQFTELPRPPNRPDRSFV